jgi:2-hydroxy-6-oxonona-2,4-dienedioate hydrolase
VNSQPIITTVEANDPRAQAAVAAERRLFEHYQLGYSVRDVDLPTLRAKVRVLDVGAGEPVLLVPGGSGDAWQFAPLMAELTGRRMIAINRPGGGLSDAVDHRKVDLRRFAVETLLAVLDAFELDQVPIICNSMGGLWGFWLALDAPERVSSIVQLGCPALILNTSAPLFMRLLSVPGVNRLVVSGLQPGSRAKALDGLRFQGSRAEHIEALPGVVADAAYAFFNLPTYRDSWRTLSEATMSLEGARPHYQLRAGQLARITQPVHLIWGDNDPFGDVGVARQVVQSIPNVSLRVAHAGHLPHVDCPAECAELIDAFLGVGALAAS